MWYTVNINLLNLCNQREKESEKTGKNGLTLIMKGHSLLNLLALTWSNKERSTKNILLHITLNNKLL